MGTGVGDVPSARRGSARDDSNPRLNKRAESLRDDKPPLEKPLNRRHAPVDRTPMKKPSMPLKKRTATRDMSEIVSLLQATVKIIASRNCPHL